MRGALASARISVHQRFNIWPHLVIWGGEFGRTPFLPGKIKETSAMAEGLKHNSLAGKLWIVEIGRIREFDEPELR